MKRILSLTLALSLILSSFVFTVFADETAQLTTVTVDGATLIPSFSPDVYVYDVIVDDEEAELPEIEFDSDVSVIKEAEVLGDYTEIKVTDTDSIYKFTYRAPYEIASNPSTTSYDIMGSSVRTDRPTYTMGDATRNYTWLLKAADSTYTAGITYIPIFKVDISNIENVESYGKFELSLAFNKKPNSDIDIAVRDTNAVDTWTHGTVTYNVAFGTGNITPFKEDAAVIYNTKDATTVVSGYNVARIDITSIIKKKIAENDTLFTLALDVPENIAAEFRMYNHVIANNGLKPAILCYPVVKSSEASLKSATITNGIMNKEFDPETYEYTIGVADGEEAALKYVLANSHANVEYTPGGKAGETAIVKVTSQDEASTKTYTFNFVSYADFGISEDAEIEISNVNFSENNNNIELKADLKNLNVNKKKLTIVTLSKQNGALIEDSIAAVTNEYATGAYKNVLLTSVAIPTGEGVSVEAYIYDTTDENNKKAVSGKVVYPSEAEYIPTVTATDKAISLKANADKPGNVIVFGKGEPNEIVTFFVAYPNKELSTFSLTELNEKVAALDMVTADSEGYWETSVAFPDVAGNYVAYLNAETVSDSFLHATFAQKKAEIEKVYEEIYKDQDKESAIANIKAILGMKAEENITDLILGIDTSSLNTLKEEDVIDIIYNLTKEVYDAEPEVADDNDIIAFVELYDKSVILTKLNKGTVISVTDLISTFAFPDSSELTALLSDLNADYLDKVDEAVASDMISSEKIRDSLELDGRIKRSILFTLINYPENPADAQDVIDTYGEYLNLNMSSYDDVINKANLVSELVNKGPFASINSLSTELNTLAVKYLNAQKRPPVVSGGGGGGGGSRPSSPVITPAQGTGTAGAGEIYTDDFETEETKYFGDIENDHWAYEPTKYLNEKGILKGMEDGSFEPQRSIKREEFAKILVLAFGLKTKGEDKEFSDVKNTEWYYEYVKIASENGIINGIGDGVFGAGGELSRQDIAVMLARVLNKTDVSDEVFADDSEISDYAKDAVYTLKKLGILSGTGNGNFEPKRAVTRAECAKIVYELIKE